MPVIVIGADTAIGRAVVVALSGSAAELRAFVSNVDDAVSLKASGVKVAIGDVSDDSHVSGAAYRTFCAILVSEAAVDARQRSFASDSQAVVSAWGRALDQAGTTRAIWIGAEDLDPTPIRDAVEQFAIVDPTGRSLSATVTEVVDLESATHLPDR